MEAQVSEINLYQGKTTWKLGRKKGSALAEREVEKL